MIDDLTIEALRRAGTELLPLYEEALRGAFTAAPPPYGMEWYGDRYRAFALQPGWLEQSLIANAMKESEGSAKLWVLAAQAADDEISEKVRVHAIDEARHARYYVAMLNLAFPRALDTESLNELLSLFPKFAGSDAPERTRSAPKLRVVDELIQMNIGEIRTRVHQLLLRPVILAVCPGERRDRLERLLDELLGDETRHIQYTARLIERDCKFDPHYVTDTFLRRVEEFNRITLEEVGVAAFE